MKKEDKIKKQIFSKVREFYGLKNDITKFHPGIDPVPYAGRVFDEQELINLINASLDFWLTAGKYAHEFEKKLSSFLGVRYCLLANSGSSANLLAVSALTSPFLGERQLKPGDEVITTACGFPTTLNPILQNNLVPVFIDVDLMTYNIQVDKIEKAISKKTKAIFISHTLGNPADIDALMKIASKNNLWLIEDNCDALGSRYKGRLTGSFGDMSTCSFYPAHHITTGEGGAVLTNDALLRQILLSLRDWGRGCWCETGQDNTCKKRFAQKFGHLPFGYDHKYVYSHIGYNLKVTDMQAAVGVAQLKKLPKFIETRKKNFDRLYQSLKQYNRYFLLPQATKGAEPSWFGFPVFIKKEAPFSRKDIVNFLEKNKIATRMLFGGNLTKQPAYKDIKHRIFGRLENTDQIMNNLFWIGVYPGITEDKLIYIGKIFRNFMEQSGGR